MTYYDEQLQQLQAQMARFKQLEAMIKELRSQRDTLAAQVRELESIKLEEQADVDRLEGRSLAAFFYHVIGKMDEQLDKERREAYAARVKYDAAVRELEGTEADLHRYEADLSALRGCERRYEAVLKEKAEAIKAAGGANGEEIRFLLELVHALLQAICQVQAQIPRRYLGQRRDCQDNGSQLCFHSASFSANQAVFVFQNTYQVIENVQVVGCGCAGVAHIVGWH